jgi:3'(2'), 5'-bisphosphate nucleotidase
MAKSRFYDHPGTTSFFKSNHVAKSEPIGAALKCGRIMRREINVYPRFVGTSEWGNAASQAILVAAGGDLVDLETSKSL